MKIRNFCLQHLRLLFSLWVMTAGIAFCVRSHLGSSVISVLPFVFETAGKESLAPALTIGQYTYIINGLLVVGQIFILRRRFPVVQLFQFLIGVIFGMLLDLNMFLTTWLTPAVWWSQALTQIAGCTILGIGIAIEVRCHSITMPGEGFPVAISKITGFEFTNVKIGVDTALVILGVITCYTFFGAWQWNIVGIGTLFAMFYVGLVVRIAPRLYERALHLG